MQKVHEHHRKSMKMVMVDGVKVAKIYTAIYPILYEATIQSPCPGHQGFDILHRERHLEDHQAGHPNLECF
jgi:hypothetical protein